MSLLILFPEGTFRRRVGSCKGRNS